MNRTTCRSCGSRELELVLDLGEQPPSNALLAPTFGTVIEKRYPLRMVVCKICWLMQVDYDVEHHELFNGLYPYFSGSSKQWQAHCKDYVAMITKRLGLTAGSYVIEVGGNDGTLLQNFNCDTLNVEPSGNVAGASMDKNIPTVIQRFQNVTANRHGADLIIANNVLAHDPDLNGFAAAITRNLAPKGTCTIEFPWAKRLISDGEFDTIYHEHYSYFSLTSLDTLLSHHALCIYDAEYLPNIHGGSIRAYVGHVNAHPLIRRPDNVLHLMLEEFNLQKLQTYQEFKARAHLCAADLLQFLQEHPGVVLGAGAAAKATVFTNFAGITRDDIPLVGDNTPAKWRKFLPGSGIEIVPEDEIVDAKPEYILIFPWNWSSEIMGAYRSMGYKGKFVTAIPKLEVFE
jgi:C-methyltransferase C-terminal domain/Putative zinc binding domain/Methyltransferase domain